MTRDPYEVLGVDRGASQSDIQATYRRLARRHHPDVNADPAAEERFKRVNEAYAVLSDPVLRARYDRHASRAAGASGAGPSGAGASGAGPSGAGPSGAGPGGPSGRTGRRIPVRTAARHRAGPDAANRRRGADTEMEIEVTVEEAYTGGRRRLTLSTPDGSVVRDITFPPGAGDDTRIRLTGLGESGRGGGPDGDLYLNVRLAPHPRFRVDARDVTVDLPVAPWEAALGATVPLDLPDGPVRVVLPAGSSTGRRLRVRGHGLPNSDGPAGDLYAVVIVVVPPQLSFEERTLFQRLAESSTFDPRASERVIGG